jgi:FHA domain-containing protein
MSMKSWVLHRVQGIGAASGRPDLGRDTVPFDDPVLGADATTRLDAVGFAEPSLADVEHLGAYAPLIRAVRDELEHFVASQVRLHVVIADRDGFTLTAIGVRSPGGAAARDLLHRFMQEFRPEQVKRYLAREVIGRLPNAAVIDLSQFAGLCDLEARDRAEEDGEYRELIAALRPGPETAATRPYEISVLGRWSENDAPANAGRDARGPATPSTPLAGRRHEFDIVDGDGARRALLHAVIPGRRYVIGKGRDADIRVNGTYTSRRHAELWLERGTWHVADAGSTNGIRVEPAAGARKADAVLAAVEPDDADPLRSRPLDATQRIVLSARTEGPPGDYPSIALRAAPQVESVAAADAIAPAARATPPARATPSTPRTAVLATRAAEPVFEIAALGEGEGRVHAIRRSELPMTVGRSRGQTLVIDWRHAGVSGHHLDIESIDEHAAHGVVHGDNGIDLGGAHLGAGAPFRWAIGETMVLGGALPGEPRCALVLSRRVDD